MNNKMMNKMKKSIILILVIVGIIVIATIGYKLANFKIFEIEKKSLLELPIKGADYSVDISFIQAGATTEDVIQLKKVYKSGKEEIIRNFSKYNFLIKSELINDSLILVVVQDTGYYGNKPDTFNISIIK
jgi:hypothetical protein